MLINKQNPPSYIFPQNEVPYIACQALRHSDRSLPCILLYCNSFSTVAPL